MKLFILLISTLFLFAKCSNIHTCGQEIHYNLKIQNLTSKNVKIATYQYGYSLQRSHFKTIDIAPKSNYNEELNVQECDWFSSLSSDGLFFNTDSVIIFYEKEKFKSFTCLERPRDSTNCNEPRNPLMFKSSNTIEYTITEEDYQNAEECDERCE